MRHNGAAIAMLAAMLLCTACHKTPRGVIGKGDMEDLLVDLYKADAYCNNYPSQFPDDSTRMVLKQSVFAKHGFTQHDYDTSLVWYAHNMEVYSDIYRRVVERLDGELAGVDNARPTAASRRRTESPAYHTVSGDTADLWAWQRTWELTPALREGYIPFDVELDHERQLGDRYCLRLKVTGACPALAALVAADYSDGGTVTSSTGHLGDGWNDVQLQTDSLRIVSRVYGYVKYRIPPQRTVIVDSTQLLRTHLDRDTYTATLNGQLVAERNVRKATTSQDDSATQDDERHSRAAGTMFTPKEGLHKSSVPRHIQSSPNANHLPRRN